MIGSATALLVPLNVLDPSGLLQGWGPWALLGVAIMIFIESGLLFPFLPGDSLVFTAGLLHVGLGIRLPVLIAVVCLAAFAGNQVGYWLGSRYGARLFREDARILKTKYLQQAGSFFGNYGGRSIILARFVPLVRTYVPVVAGLVHHPYRSFVGWNLVGALTWSAVMVIAGNFLGRIDFIAQHIDILAIVIVAISLIPVALQITRAVRSRGGQAQDDL